MHDPSRGLLSQDRPKGCLQEGPCSPPGPIPTRHLLEGPDILRQGPSFWSEICPIIFNAVVDTLAWAMLCVGIPDFVHYLDSFLFWAPDYPPCSLVLETAARLSARLGPPVEHSKVEGPATTLTFLGIEIDTVSRELRLPRLKLARLKDTVEHWATRHSMTKHQLEVLIGQLNDAAQVVPTGHPFLRNLLDAKSLLSKPRHFMRAAVLT